MGEEQEPKGTISEKRRQSALMVAAGLKRRAMDLEAVPFEERDYARIVNLRQRAKDLEAEAGPEPEHYSSPMSEAEEGAL